MPRHCSCSAASAAISATSVAVGSTFTCVSTIAICRPGSIRMFIAAQTLPPGRRPITWSMHGRGRSCVPNMPQIMPSASFLTIIIAPISVSRRRVWFFAYRSVTPRRADIS